MMMATFEIDLFSPLYENVCDWYVKYNWDYLNQKSEVGRGRIQS
jgi:hypothetical protein